MQEKWVEIDGCSEKAPTWKDIWIKREREPNKNSRRDFLVDGNRSAKTLKQKGTQHVYASEKQEDDQGGWQGVSQG